MKYGIYLITDNNGNKCDRLYVGLLDADINRAHSIMERYYQEDIKDIVYAKQKYEVREIL